MKNRKKRNIIIVSLACLMIFMGVGYAILSENIKVGTSTTVLGDWDIKITNVALSKKSGRAYDVSHTFETLSTTLVVDLYEPGDSIEYDITVRNEGNINATLSRISAISNTDFFGIVFSNTGMSQG